jgi:hypothetical protein
MSHLYRKDVQYNADSANIDAFGRLRVSNVTSLIEVQHLYDKQPLTVSEKLNGSGTSTHDMTNSLVTMSVGNSASVIRQTKAVAMYQPGKGQLIEASFSNFQTETNVVKRVGYFTGPATPTNLPNSTYDGIFLESDGVSGFGYSWVICHKDVGIVTRIPIIQWSNAIVDPTTIDWSKSQLLFIDFQWLGTGRVRMGLVIDGKVIYFASYTPQNVDTTPYMKSPAQPIRYEIMHTTTGANVASLNMICAQVSLEGAINRLSKQQGINNFAETTLATAGTKYPVLGYRIGSTYNAVSSLMESVQIIATSAATDHSLITVEINPTLSVGPTWNTITNSPLEYALGTGVATVTSPGFVLSNFIAKGGSIAETDILLAEVSLKPGFSVDGVSDQIWVCITPSANASKFRTTANIAYWM